MSLEFHDGTHTLYRQYSTKPWNDAGLLQLDDSKRGYDKWLMETYNTQEAMTELLQGEAVANCYPFGEGKSKLSEFIAAEGTGIIIVKGLHQWQRVGKTWNYKLHVTLGLSGQLWHLYALYKEKGSVGSVAFTSTCTAGERVTGESHDGFTRVGGRKR